MARLKFEGTLSELMSMYTEAEIHRQPKTTKDLPSNAKTHKDLPSNAKTHKDLPSNAKTHKDILVLTNDGGNRSCGYTNRSWFLHTFEDIKPHLEELAAEIDLSDLDDDALLDDIIRDVFHTYENVYDDDVIYIEDDCTISQETTEQELENQMLEMCGDEYFITYEDQWYRYWNFTAEIELPHDRKRGQIHTLDCEVEFSDWGEASPAGMGVDWGEFIPDTFLKKCKRFIAITKINQSISEVKDMDLDIELMEV